MIYPLTSYLQETNFLMMIVIRSYLKALISNHPSSTAVHILLIIENELLIEVFQIFGAETIRQIKMVIQFYLIQQPTLDTTKQNSQ